MDGKNTDGLEVEPGGPLENMMGSISLSEDQVVPQSTVSSVGHGQGNCYGQVQQSSVQSACEGCEKQCSQVLVSGIAQNVTEDHLINYLECLPGPERDVKDVQKGDKRGVVIVTFENCVDLTALQQACNENPLEGEVLRVGLVDTRGAVLIQDPNANTATNSFKYYLSNTKRSGGERGVEIERDPDNSFLIAYFSSKEVAVRVAEKKHKLEDCPLHVEVFDPNLGDVHRKRTKESRKLSSEVDINIPEPASGNLYPDLRSFEDSADGSGTGSFSNLDRKEEPEVAPPKEIEITVEGMHPVYQAMLEAFRDWISRMFDGIDITVDEDVVRVRGKEGFVEDAQILLENLVRTQSSSMYLASVPDQFDGWEQIFLDIEEKIGGGEYYLFRRNNFAAGLPEDELCVATPNSEVSLDAFLESLARGTDICVKSSDAEEVLFSTAWDDFFENDFDFGKEVVVVKHAHQGKVTVFGSAEVLDQAADTVRGFLQNAPSTERFDLSPVEKDFLRRFCKDQLEMLQNEDVEIMFKAGNCFIKGLRRGVAQASRKLRQICGKLRCTREVFSYPGLTRIVHLDDWKEVLEQVSISKRCLITELPDSHIQDANPDSDEWGSWLAMVVHTFQYPSEYKVHVVDGDAMAMAVDAVICLNKQGLPQPLPSAGATEGSGARPKTSTHSRSQAGDRGQSGLTVTQSGTLPCKALIQVDPQTYFWRGDSSIQVDGIKALVKDILQAAEQHCLSSIAMPVLGVDVSNRDHKLPIDIAATAIVETIRDYIYTLQNNWPDPEKRSALRDICLCSTRPACIRGLEFAFDDMPAAQTPSLDSYRLLTHTPDVTTPSPRPGRVLKKEAIQIVIGDVANSQADVIVVPLDTDLDVNKNKVTRSLASRGGQDVEYTLQHGERKRWSWFSPGTPAEVREEEYGETRFLVGQGGSLQASYIFYLYLPPWGPEVREILTKLLQKSLREASKRKCKTVALTALGTGRLGYPAEFVARTMLSVISTYMEQETCPLEKVKIVIFPTDQTSKEVFFREHTQWLANRVYPYETYGQPVHQQGVQDHKSHRPTGYTYASALTTSRSTSVYGSPYGQQRRGGCSKSFQVESVKITVKVGNIIDEKCDFIVNSTNKDFDLTRGGVSKALVHRFGQDFENFCSKKGNKKKIAKGSCVTPIPSVNNKKVLHIDLDKFDGKLKAVITKCLQVVRDAKTKTWAPKSVGFPLLGTGAHSHNPEDMVMALVNVCKEQKQKLKHVDDVRLVVAKPEHFERLVNFLENLQKLAQKGKPGKPPAGNSPKASAATARHSSDPPVRSTSNEGKPRTSSTSRGTGGESISLFIFSDHTEYQEEVRDEIASRIETLMEFYNNPTASGPPRQSSPELSSQFPGYSCNFSLM